MRRLPTADTGGRALRTLLHHQPLPTNTQCLFALQTSARRSSSFFAGGQGETKLASTPRTNTTSAAASVSKGDSISSGGIATTVLLQSAKGFDWIDFTSASPEVEASLALDGGFVAATSRMLRKHNIPAELIRKVTTDVWLPLTHLSSSGDVICFVMRVIRPADSIENVADGTSAERTHTSSAAIRAPLWLLEAAVRESHSSDASVPPTHRNLSSQSHTTSDDELRPASPGNSLNRRSQTILELTTRVTIFISKRHRKIISVHRAALPFVMEIQRQWAERHRFSSMDDILFRIVRGGVETFHHCEVNLASRMDALESAMFRSETTTGAALLSLKGWKKEVDDHGIALPYSSKFATTGMPLSDGAVMLHIQTIHRQASAYVRVLREVERAFQQAIAALKTSDQSLEPSTSHDGSLLSPAEQATSTEKTESGNERLSAHRWRDLQQRIQAATFLWEGLRDQSQALLSLQVSVAVSRLEELLRLLTVFSTVFIPLEFITAFFGMNFSSILTFGHEPYAWGIACLLMVVTAAVTQRWIKRTSTAHRVASTYEYF